MDAEVTKELKTIQILPILFKVWAYHSRFVLGILYIKPPYAENALPNCNCARSAR
jgi:hypothetical protein